MSARQNTERKGPNNNQPTKQTNQNKNKKEKEKGKSS
jgi:hypothetical protein